RGWPVRQIEASVIFPGMALIARPPPGASDHVRPAKGHSIRWTPPGRTLFAYAPAATLACSAWSKERAMRCTCRGASEADAACKVLGGSILPKPIEAAERVLSLRPAFAVQAFRPLNYRKSDSYAAAAAQRRSAGVGISDPQHHARGAIAKLEIPQQRANHRL